MPFPYGDGVPPNRTRTTLVPDALAYRLVGGNATDREHRSYTLGDRGPHRAEGRRDRDRILYSQAWRRLAGVTQVVSPHEGHAPMHNRLTHSEKVAQVARSIAENLLQEVAHRNMIVDLGGLDADVAEAAALAHDLGHAPFGHIGEETLDDIARGDFELPDGFEGNAQSLRILLVTETRHPDYDGLNLTRATLAATAKYPWTRQSRAADPHHERLLVSDADYRRRWSKFNAYSPEAASLADARTAFPAVALDVQTLEASIMDAADDITYALHDLEDFYLAGDLDMRAVLERVDRQPGSGPLLPSDDFLDRLATRLRRDYSGYFERPLLDQASADVHSFLRVGFAVSFDGSVDAIGRARAKISDEIGTMLGAIEIGADPAWEGGPHVYIRQDVWHRVQILKEVTRELVITRPDIAVLQRGQQALLRRLVGSLRQWVDSPRDRSRLPRRLRHELDVAAAQQEALGSDVAHQMGYGRVGDGVGAGTRLYAPRGEPLRCLIDYVCGLTDGECVSLDARLSGTRAGSPGKIL